MILKNTILITCLLFLSSQYCVGQAQQQNNWEHLANDKINDNGTALTYRKTYMGKKDLVLKNLISGQELIFENMIGETVLTDQMLLFLNKEDSNLYKVKVDDFTIDTIKNTADFHWIPKERKIVTYSVQTGNLQVFNADNERVKRMKRIITYCISPDEDKILTLDDKGVIRILDITSNKTKAYNHPILQSLKVKKAIWSNDNQTTFLFANNSEFLKIFKVDNEGVKLMFKSLLEDSCLKTLVDTTFRDVRLIDNSKIAIGVKNKQIEKQQQGTPLIFHGSYGGITPKLYKGISVIPQLAIIDLKKKEILNFFNRKKAKRFMIDAFDGTVYSYDQYEKDNLTKYHPDISVDTFNFQKKAYNTFKELEGASSYLINFENHSNLYFFENNALYSYDKKQKEFINLTTLFLETNPQLKTGISNNDLQIKRTVININDYQLLLSIQGNLWLFDTKKKKFENLTYSNEEKKEYKFEECNIAKNHRPPWSWDSKIKLKDYKDWIISWTSENYSEEGIALVNGKKVENILSDNKRITQISRSESCISYIKESSNQPPCLYYFDLKRREEIKIYQSNYWDKTSKNQKTEYVSWKNDKGENRGAIIRFPLNYAKEKKYPAIVSIYEKKYPIRNHYQSPYTLHTAGFNYKKYVEKDYFVIEPDIYYRIQDPGWSALESIEESLDYMIANYSIDSEKIGLIGHSFGGYETNFIITQTNKFKAAVAGAGVADLTSYYLTLNEFTLKPEIWRFETQQFRMGNSLFEIPCQYKNNSPITYAKNIHTPLLLWSGTKDSSVYFGQSIAMFLALKRLKKNVNLILYPDEEHTISGLQNQIDLNEKIMEWFEFYLKEKKEPKWLKEGLQ